MFAGQESEREARSFKKIHMTLHHLYVTLYQVVIACVDPFFSLLPLILIPVCAALRQCQTIFFSKGICCVIVPKCVNAIRSYTLWRNEPFSFIQPLSWTEHLEGLHLLCHILILNDTL